MARAKINPSTAPAKGDLDDFPVYTYSPATFDTVVEEAGLDLSGLLLWNIVLAISSFLIVFIAGIATGVAVAHHGVF